MSIDLQSLPAWVLPLGIFCNAIYFLVLVIRRVVEAVFPKVLLWAGWKKTLRAIPAILGGIAAAVMYKYPFLDTLPTWGTRFIYGAFAGGMSSFFYMLTKAVLQKYFGVKLKEGDTVPPPADEDAPTQELPKLRGTGYSGPDNEEPK